MARVNGQSAASRGSIYNVFYLINLITDGPACTDYDRRLAAFQYVIHYRKLAFASGDYGRQDF